MAEFDRKKLEQEFKSLPNKVAAIIAARAALRTLPWFSSQAGFTYWSDDRRSKNLHAIFSCYQNAAFFSCSAFRLPPTTPKFGFTIFAQLKRAEAGIASVLLGADTSILNAIAASEEVPATIRAGTLAAAYASNCATNQLMIRTAARRIEAVAPYERKGSTHLDAAYAAATAVSAAQFSTDALEQDLALARSTAPTFLQRLLKTHSWSGRLLHLLRQPLWPQGMPAEIETLWQTFQTDALALNAGFEVWLDWYRERLDGKPFNFEIERQWAFLSDERRAQSPAEINAYLASLRGGSASKQLRRVRAIFIGHGGAGKTSLIRALHGETVIEGREEMTPGVAIQDAKMAEEAGVFTKVTHLNDDDLTVHFWDFGGQVMAHATHQFFLRANCLYVIVLDARPERNANEEAEYWLEHVRAFGDNAPVLIVGNKSDVMPVNLDLRSLKQKHSNIADFYPLSCTKAQGDYKAEFDRFNRDFRKHLTTLGERAERFTPAQFKVLKEVQAQAERDDFLPESRFDELCQSSGVAMEGPGGRDSLLKFFDTLGIVLHFPDIRYLTEYVLNPRWLTYGVYTVMYSDAAKEARGRVGEDDLEKILKSAKPLGDGTHALSYPRIRCKLIADAMVAFRVAYRLANSMDRLVIPALLEPQQPVHDFKTEGALAFQFDFKGFLPRHVLPALIVDHHQHIAAVGGRQIVWQNGVLLCPSCAHDAEALVTADYHARNIEILVQGSDANAYLGVIRASIGSTLLTMPELRFDENVMVRPDMCVEGSNLDILRDAPVWADYESVRTAQKFKQRHIAVGRHMYDLEKVLTVMPVRPEHQPADVFISYAHKDRAAVDNIAGELKAKGYTVWYDPNLVGGQQFRDNIDLRIDAAKAVIAVWTDHSVGSKWVRHEASRADDQRKLICLRDPALEHKRIPGPFPANHHIIQLGKPDDLLKALARACKKPR